MKAPAFLLYTGDFLSSPDVQLMEAHEVGAYCLLLFNSWQSDRPGFLPNDEGRLRRTARLTTQQWAESRTLLLAKFPEAPDAPTLRYNPRLVAEATKQLHYRELKAKAGQASAAKRAANPTGVENKATPVEHLLAETTLAAIPQSSIPTPVEVNPTSVAAQPNTRSENSQQDGNLSLSLSRDSSLRSESGAADAAKPAPKASKSTKKPVVPTLAEVQAFAAAQYPNSAADAQAEAAAFCDHYASNGWRVSGKTPMVDWHAAFRGWMRRRTHFLPVGSQGTSQATPARARSAPKSADPTRWS
ncbi:MAG: YdaU family protein [Bacteroidota bacterium]|nr:YdaU family protein [Bacteroidota bacterium]